MSWVFAVGGDGVTVDCVVDAVVGVLSLGTFVITIATTRADAAMPADHGRAAGPMR